MHLYVLLPAIALIIGLNFVRLSIVWWVAVWWLTIYGILKYGFVVPIPGSVIQQYMVIVSIVLGVYVIADKERLDEIKNQFLSLVTQKQKQAKLIGVLVAIPLITAVKVYSDSQVKIEAPIFGRSVHPAPPQSISFKGRDINMLEEVNPYRKLEETDQEKFKEHVEDGRRVYYQNCHFCHGDNMKGNGQYAYGLEPMPTNFADATTIAMLTETFLFWRISKGGIGLPDEGGPWASAMPAWEEFLTEEEIWNVILFLYDYTGQRPRAKEEHQ